MELEALPQVLHVVVVELDHGPEPKPGSIDDAGVVELVEVHDVAALNQAGDHSQVYLEAGGKRQRRRFVHELGEFLLKLNVDVQGAVKEPRPGAASSVLGDRVLRGPLDLGVAGEP